MTRIEEKYFKNRHLIQDGDLILFHGNGLVATLIRSSDKNIDGSWAWHNHIGIVIEKLGSLFILDANGDGVQADRLSWRIKKYNKDGDFSIIRSLASRNEIDCEMSKLLKRSDDNWIRYDFKNGIKELLNRRFGFKFRTELKSDRFICSTNDAQFANNLGMMKDEFKYKTIVFPEDYIRYLNPKKAKMVRLNN